MNRYRAVALLLAALAPRDSRWLFERLPAQHRARIGEELPAARRLQRSDPVHCAQWLRQLTGAGVVRPGEVAADAIDTIELAPVQTIKAVLQGLPDRLLAEVIWFRSWRWKAALVERLSDNERRLVVDGPSSGRPVAPAVLGALLGLIAERVRGGVAPGRSFEAWVKDETWQAS